MLSEFTKQLIKTQQKMFMHWSMPVEITFNTFFRYAEMTQQMLKPIGEKNLQSDLSSDYEKTAVSKNDHVAVVTGGIGDIGTDICKHLVKQGNKVIATFISFEAERAAEWQKERRAEGFDIGIIECDVSDFKSCKKMSKILENEYGRVDILVNGAGITRDATLRKMEAKNWHTVMETNLDSIFNVTRHFINGMVKRGYGRIINIASVNGHKGQFGQTNYSAAKAGMVGFTKSLARELADYGITVNTVSPGYVDTSMLNTIPKAIKQGIIDKIPMGRLATTDEISNAVTFLASSDSGYITGSDLPVNGGLFMG